MDALPDHLLDLVFARLKGAGHVARAQCVSRRFRAAGARTRVAIQLVPRTADRVLAWARARDPATIAAVGARRTHGVPHWLADFPAAVALKCTFCRVYLGAGDLFPPGLRHLDLHCLRYAIGGPAVFELALLPCAALVSLRVALHARGWQGAVIDTRAHPRLATLHLRAHTGIRVRALGPAVREISLATTSAASIEAAAAASGSQQQYRAPPGLERAEVRSQGATDAPLRLLGPGVQSLIVRMPRLRTAWPAWLDPVAAALELDMLFIDAGSVGPRLRSLDLELHGGLATAPLPAAVRVRARVAGARVAADLFSGAL